MGTAVGAEGIEADSDKAIFPNVNLEVHFGHDKGIKFRLPWIIPGIGSTDIAKNNWEGLAIGSALAGTGLTIGENVVGMDMEAKFENGRPVDTVDLKRRVKLYKDSQRDGYGAIIVQANVEDTRLGIQEYAIEKLGAEVVEKAVMGSRDLHPAVAALGSLGGILAGIGYAALMVSGLRTWWLAALITRWKLDSLQYGHRTSVSSPLSMISISKNELQDRHLNS